MFEKLNKDIIEYGKLHSIPILAICQGYQLLIVLELQENILSNFKNTPARFQGNTFTSKAISNIQKYGIFSKFSEKDIRNFTERNINLHYHNYGVSFEQFTSYDILMENYDISSIGFDRENNCFINSIHHKNHYIHAVQYHLEAGNSFYSKKINRTEDEFRLSQEISKLIFEGLKEEMLQRQNSKKVDNLYMDDAKYAYLGRQVIDESYLEFNELDINFLDTNDLEITSIRFSNINKEIEIDILRF